MPRKRIQISGHSYKYDIIYHSNPKVNLIKDNNTHKRSAILSKTNFRKNDLIIPIDNIQNNLIFGPRIQRHNHSLPPNQYKQIGKLFQEKNEDATIKYKNDKKREVNHSEAKTGKEFGTCTQSSTTSKISSSEIKRDVNSFIVKDVSALDVIVDLMKMNESYQEGSVLSFANNNRSSKEIHPLLPITNNPASNLLQLHIAIPYSDNLKSLESVKGCKIFSAFLSTPVDIEYKIQSIEDTTDSKVLIDNILSPGLYLIVEKSNNSNSPREIVLKPVSDDFQSPNHVIRQATVKNNLLRIIDTEIVDKNQYHNSSFNRIDRSIPKREGSKSKQDLNKLKQVFIFNDLNRNKRLSKWDTIIKYIGHDRVCPCHCKVDKTMCKTCAASDKVISELMFDFENLAKYMTDHCTEIQTFLWMNPTQGRKLRQVVHRINVILNDYYKRVKGKCQGRTCQMVSTTIDKREFPTINSYKHTYTLPDLITNISKLADQLKLVLNDDVCFYSLLCNGNMYMNALNRCLIKRYVKRHVIKANVKLSTMKNWYPPHDSRGKIIDCHNPMHITTKTGIFNQIQEKKVPFTQKMKKNYKRYSNYDQMRFEYPNQIKNYNKPIGKRQIKSIYEAEPSIFSDVSGSFWYEYIKSNSDKSRYPRKSFQNPLLKMIVIPDKNKIGLDTTNNTEGINTIKTSVTYDTKLNKKVMETKDNNIKVNTSNTFDYEMPYINSLNYNMKELFKLLGNTELSSKDNSNILITKNKKSNELLQPTLSQIKSKENLRSKNKIFHKVSTNFLNLLQSRNKNKTTQWTHSKEKTKNFNVLVKIKSVKMPFMCKSEKVKNKNDNGNIKRNTINPTLKDNSSDIGGQTDMSLKRNSLESIETLSIPDGILTQINHESLTESFNVIANTTFKNPTIIIIEDKRDINVNECNSTKNVECLKNSVINQTSGIKASTSTMLVPKNNKLNTKTCHHLATSAMRGLINKIADKLSFKSKFKSKKCKEAKKKYINEKTTVKRDGQHTKPLFSSTIKKKTKGGNTKPHYNDKNLVTFTEINEQILKICDLPATIAHIYSIQQIMVRADFQRYVKQLNCFKHNLLPKFLKVNVHHRHEMKRSGNSYSENRFKINLNATKSRVIWWNSIRDKRCLKHNEMAVRQNIFHVSRYNDLNDEKILSRHVHQAVDAKDRERERYIIDAEKTDDKGTKSILSKYAYVIKNKNAYKHVYKNNTNNCRRNVKRRKRTTVNQLKLTFQNLPPLEHIFNEKYVMIGDNIIINCSSANWQNTEAHLDWTTDRSGMLDYNNIIINESIITIRNITAKNSGTYICSKGKTIVQTMRLTVIELPQYNILFTPLYKFKQNCTYEDLKAIEKTGKLMTKEACGDHCLITVQEPICLKDRVSGLSLLRSLVVISSPRINIDCSSECRRDIHSSLALLSASNVPAFAAVSVLVCYGETYKCFTPTKRRMNNAYVTHTLRRKDSRESYQYQNVNVDIDTQGVKIMRICPAGFYLIDKQNICVVCPSDTYSSKGDNVCTMCNHGVHSTPGSNSCHHLLHRVERVNINWKEIRWIIGIFSLTTFCIFVICCGFARLFHKSSKAENKQFESQRKCKSSQRSKIRPISPSRVLLSKLLRVSPSSSRATDSQETRFELWKERNVLPPLPPIDFEL